LVGGSGLFGHEAIFLVGGSGLFASESQLLPQIDSSIADQKASFGWRKSTFCPDPSLSWLAADLRMQDWRCRSMTCITSSVLPLREECEHLAAVQLLKQLLEAIHHLTLR